MQEFGITVVDALKQGLAPDRRAEARGDFVSSMVNIRPTRFGAEGVSHLTMPAGLYDRLSWPFPQVFHGRRFTFVCTQTEILVVKDGHEDQLDNVSRLETVKWDTINTKVSIPAGGRWNFVDNGTSVYFYNGECVVFSLFEDLSPGNLRAYINTDLPINAGTRFRGRNVFGGLGPGIFDHFTELLSEVQDTSNEVQNLLGTAPVDIDVDEFRGNHVMWSSIGGGDFPAWLFWPEAYSSLSGDSDITPTWDKIRRRFKRNQIGWIELELEGTVKNLVPLADVGVVAYTDNFTSILAHTSGGGDVPATFGQRVITRIGLKSKGAVATGPDGQVFLGDDGRLRLIAPNLEVEELGYKQHLEDLHDPVVEYEPREGEYFVSGRDRAFSLGSRGAFFGHTRAVSSIETINAESKFAVKSVGGGNAEIETSFIDFGQTGLKTITQVDVDYRGPYEPYVSVQYRYSAEKPLRSTEWKQVNRQGALRVRVSAKEFKVAVYFPGYEDVEVDDIKIRFQLPDKRSVRGTRANPVNT